MTSLQSFTAGWLAGIGVGVFVAFCVYRVGLKVTVAHAIERDRVWTAKSIARASVELSHGRVFATAIVLRVFGRKGMEYLADPYEIDRRRGYRIPKEGSVP